MGLNVSMNDLILDMHMVEAFHQILNDFGKLFFGEELSFLSFFQNNISEGFACQLLLDDDKVIGGVGKDLIYFEKSSEEGPGHLLAD